jgi:hypothetical protein
MHSHVEITADDEVLTFINVMTSVIVTAQEESTFAFAHFAAVEVEADVAAVSIILHTLVNVNA